jgi:hypothetical protein
MTDETTKVTVNVKAIKKIPGGVRIGGGITVKVNKPTPVEPTKSKWYNRLNPISWFRSS